MNYEDALCANIERALEQAALFRAVGATALEGFWLARAKDLDNEVSRLECEAIGAEMERNSREFNRGEA